MQNFNSMALFPAQASPLQLREQQDIERGTRVLQLLSTCINYVTEGDIRNANIILEQLSTLASPEGDPLQRLTAYFAEALAERALKSCPGLHKALNSTDIATTTEEIQVRKVFFDLCPFLKVAYVVSNQAILEAMQGEKVIHIIDFNCFEPAPWINLLILLSGRPDGPPYLKITGIHEHKEVLDRVFACLTRTAERLNVPFQFYRVPGMLENIDFEDLHVKTGEALAVSSALGVHTLLASEDAPVQACSSSSSNTASASSQDCLTGSPRIFGFLTAVRRLKPKIMVITEQESNKNIPTLPERLLETLLFYAAMFDALESRAPRTSADRLKLEKLLFGKQIKNIIACEGLERKERHEKLVQWIPRFELAGFRKMPLSFNGMLQARVLLQKYGYLGFKIKEENGCVIICWQNEGLFSVSAWIRR